MGGAEGDLFALDAKSGCIYWHIEVKADIRSAITLGERNGGGLTAYFGDQAANMYAVDAATGKILWKVKVDDHPQAAVTAASALYAGRLYVPVSSREESKAADPKYPCCTFHGSVLALDAATGKRIWKTYTIPEAPRPVRKSSKGVQLWTGAGAGVWSAPTIDVQRRAIYVGTVNGFTEPAPKTTDAIVAMDLETGKTLWSVQDLDNDAFVEECTPGNENCPVSNPYR